MDCRGGDYPDSEGEVLNAFGKAFRNAGYQWTAGEAQTSMGFGGTSELPGNSNDTENRFHHHHFFPCWISATFDFPNSTPSDPLVVFQHVLYDTCQCPSLLSDCK